MQIDLKSAKAGYLKLRAVAHPLRLQLLAFIDSHKEINVTKIYHTLKLEQSVTSQHLKILRDAGVVKARRDGKMIYYSINYDNINRIVDLAHQLESIK